MNAAVQRLLGLCFVLLFFLCAATLVEGPDRPEPPQEAPPLPAHTALAEPMTDGMLWGSLTSHTLLISRYAEPTADCADAPSTHCSRESNGWPITSRSWARTVYIACPPEDWGG